MKNLRPQDVELITALIPAVLAGPIAGVLLDRLDVVLVARCHVCLLVDDGRARVVHRGDATHAVDLAVGGHPCDQAEFRQRELLPRACATRARCISEDAGMG